MNNASIPFNTLLNVAVKAALGAPRWLWRIEYWDGIRDTNFHIVMVQLPAPRDLKRRSRTSRCRIVRRCPGQIHPRSHRSSRLAVVPGSQSIQFAIFAGTMVLIDHILDDLGPPLSTHVILIVFLIFKYFWRVMVAGVFFSRCSGWPWWLPSMPLRRDSLWPSKLPPSGRMGRTGTGSAGRRSVVSCQPGLNQQPGKNGPKMWRGQNLQPVIHQGRWFQKHLGLLPTFPPQGFASESNQSMTQYQEQVPRWQRGGPTYLDSTWHFWLTKKRLERVSYYFPARSVLGWLPNRR